MPVRRLVSGDPPTRRGGFGLGRVVDKLEAADRMLGLWERRRRTRAQLAWLDDDQLRDIGLSRRDALIEAGKPFWRP